MFNYISLEPEAYIVSDLVVASPQAQFGLPEVAVGLYAAAGGLPRLMRIVGLQLASEIAMTGRKLTAQEALQYQLVNRVTETSQSVVDECLQLAAQIASFSPDGIIVTRQGLREAWESPSVEHATTRTRHEYVNRLVAGDNFKIGVESFAKKTKPKWVPSHL
jgi:enoyl-CoA hydratase/carnithine racemase